MRNLFLIFFIFLVPFFANAHEYYISICNLNFNNNTKTLEISIRVFTDDIEKAIENQSTEKLYLATEKQSDNFDVLLEKYLKNNLKITVNDSLNTYEYIGSEVDMENVWCYLQIANIEDVSTLYIENKVLIDTYPEQINLINYTNNETKKSATLSAALLNVLFEF